MEVHGYHHRFPMMNSKYVSFWNESPRNPQSGNVPSPCIVLCGEGLWILLHVGVPRRGGSGAVPRELRGDGHTSDNEPGQVSAASVRASIPTMSRRRHVEAKGEHQGYLGPSLYSLEAAVDHLALGSRSRQHHPSNQKYAPLKGKQANMQTQNKLCYKVLLQLCRGQSCTEGTVA